jgi:hypothetical protein
MIIRLVSGIAIIRYSRRVIVGGEETTGCDCICVADQYMSAEATGGIMARIEATVQTVIPNKRTYRYFVILIVILGACYRGFRVLTATYEATRPVCCE